jgi:hypothetical protein
MKIIPLKEGNFSVNTQKEFVLLENQLEDYNDG